jgi:hypothetical protein
VLVPAEHDSKVVNMGISDEKSGSRKSRSGTGKKRIAGHDEGDAEELQWQQVVLETGTEEPGGCFELQFESSCNIVLTWCQRRHCVIQKMALNAVYIEFYDDYTIPSLCPPLN